jgi:uncharacterized protein (TIGR03503 family)
VLDGEGEGYHKLTVDAQREYVDMSTLLIDGKVQFPNGDIQNFSITDMSADVREYIIVNFGYGVYRIKLTAYGNTTEGREFILDVPEYSFLSEKPKLVVVPAETGIIDSSTADSVIEKKQAMLAAENKMSTTNLVSLILGINLFILIVGGGLIWWLTLDKKPKVKSTKEFNAVTDEKNTEKAKGFFSKIFKRQQKTTIKNKLSKKPKSSA